jgi:hypothetical protein
MYYKHILQEAAMMPSCPVGMSINFLDTVLVSDSHAQFAHQFQDGTQWIH